MSKYAPVRTTEASMLSEQSLCRRDSRTALVPDLGTRVMDTTLTSAPCSSQRRSASGCPQFQSPQVPQTGCRDKRNGLSRFARSCSATGEKLRPTFVS